MKYLWFSSDFMRRFDAWHKHPGEREGARLALREIVLAALAPDKNGIAPLPDVTALFVCDSTVECKVAYMHVADTVLALDFRRAVAEDDPTSLDGARALLLPDDVIRSWVGNRANWEGYCKGLCDAAFVERAKKRPDAYKAIGEVSSLFLPFEYRRMHMVDRPRLGLNVVLGEFDSMLWKSHSKTAQTIKQPRGIELDMWERLHRAVLDRYNRYGPTLTWRVGQAPAAPSLDTTLETWISREQLREIEITVPEHVQAVMACTGAEDLIDLIDILTEVQWTKLDLLHSRHLAHLRRQDERTVGSIAQYELNLNAKQNETGVDYEKWQSLLTPAQKEIVIQSLGVPIRLKGGPGTGKSLTAILRAAHLLNEARAANHPFRIGFFVFNRDLGQKVYQQFVTLGFEEYLRDGAPQQLVVTNLMEWCERFLELDRRGIEPIAPYRADRMDRQRAALFALTVEEARQALAGSEYDLLWREFDARTTAGLREIETEIS